MHKGVGCHGELTPHFHSFHPTLLPCAIKKKAVPSSSHMSRALHFGASELHAVVKCSLVLYFYEFRPPNANKHNEYPCHCSRKKIKDIFRPD